MNEAAVEVCLSLPNRLQRMLDENPYATFLGLEVEAQADGIHYQMAFREEHVGNVLIGTFHGGILASFAEVVAALHVAETLQLNDVPECSSMTFDYVRPAFAGTLRAQPRIVRAGRRFVVVSVDIFLKDSLVSFGRFIYAR